MGSVNVSVERQGTNVIEAAAIGASDGLKLALNVGAMLLAFLALLEMINYGFSVVGGWFGVELTLQTILGWVFRPLAWAMGISWQDSYIVGQMLGTKMVKEGFGVAGGDIRIGADILTRASLEDEFASASG